MPDPDAMLSSADVAAILGVSIRRVQQLAKSRHTGRRVGRTIVFSEDDVGRMRNRKPGRPRKESMVIE